jgi:hypothetical protein
MEKQQQVNTIIMKGSIVQQDVMPAKIIRMRPDKYMMEFDLADITAFQAFDGTSAWSTAPWTGNPKPQAMPEDRTRDMKTRADFDGILYNWKAKGHVVELQGTDTVETEPAYKFKITKADEGVEYLFISRNDLLLKKRSYTRVSRGKEVVMDNYYRDYREVEGVKFPFTIDTHFAGQLYNSLQLESVELNKPVDPKSFSMPEK